MATVDLNSPWRVHDRQTRMEVITTSRLLSRRKSIFLASGVGGLLVALILLMTFARPFNSHEEVWRISETPRPSFDTTPISFKVGAITYRIPRNYLAHVGEIPALMVTWPDSDPHWGNAQVFRFNS